MCDTLPLFPPSFHVYVCVCVCVCVDVLMEASAQQQACSGAESNGAENHSKSAAEPERSGAILVPNFASFKVNRRTWVFTWSKKIGQNASSHCCDSDFASDLPEVRPSIKIIWGNFKWDCPRTLRSKWDSLSLSEYTCPDGMTTRYPVRTQ